MLDAQLERYAGHDTLVDALLGLCSRCDDFVDAVQSPARASSPAVSDALIAFALGVVSLQQSLHALLSTATPPPSAAGTPELAPQSGGERWLR